jgi:hypothetical protein
MTCSVAMRRRVPLRLKSSDWESVFRSTNEEFCRPRSVRPLLQAPNKNPQPNVVLIATHGLQGSGQRPTTRHSHCKRAGFQFTRHHANCYYVRLTCNGRLHKVPGCSVSECVRIDPHRSTFWYKPVPLSELAIYHSSRKSLESQLQRSIARQAGGASRTGSRRNPHSSGR